MANDWIKMRSNLRSHPKVVRIASALKADRLRVVGGLHAVWCLFDEHSEDGRLCGYTPSALDDEIGFPGFSDLMVAVGWLGWDGNDGLELPEFDTHNGASAKRRAQEADRKRAERAAAKEQAEDIPNPSASDADTKRTREEKRREESSTTVEEKKRKRSPVVDRPDDVTEMTWDDWQQLRRTKRAPVTQTVLDGARTEAAKAGMSLESFLQVWCRRGSQGLEAEWIKPKERASAQQDDPKEWHETQSGVKRRAQELGLKPWNEIEEQWPAFRQRVMKADKGAAGGFLSVDQLFQMAQERSAA